MCFQVITRRGFGELIFKPRLTQFSSNMLKYLTVRSEDDDHFLPCCHFSSAIQEKVSKLALQ